MIFRNSVFAGCSAVTVAYCFLVASAMGQSYYGRTPQPRPNYYGGSRAGAVAQPQQRQGRALTPYRVAERTGQTQVPAKSLFTTPQPGEHPLMPAVRWAHQGFRELQEIEDYSATLVKRESVNGSVSDTQYIFLKIRHNPLSAYLYFLDPEDLRGQEVIFIEGQNNGKMSAHGTGFKKVFGTVSLDPTGPIAMQGQRYPITEIGLLNLTRRLIEVAEQDAQYGECEVNFFQGAKINGRSCTCIQVMHPVPRRNFLFHLARIFVDDELNIPIRYEAYDWPKQQGAKPELIEEYTYLNVKLNNGFTDADFDVNNPNYQFN